MVKNKLDNIGNIIKPVANYLKSEMQTFEFIEDQHLGFHLGSAVIHMTRGTKRDLMKALWHIERKIESLR